MIIRTIEVGGTQVRRADISFTRNKIEIFDFSTLPTSNLVSAPDFFDKLIDFSYNKGFKKDTKKIAYAVAGPIKDKEIVEFMPNVSGWPKDLNLAKFSQKKFKIKTIVLNDMEAATRGMAYLLRTKKPFWGITWSSGIGGRYWDGEKVVSDAEIGHITLVFSPSALVCSCGKKGHVEALIGGKAIETELRSKFQLKEPFPELNQAYQENKKWAVDFYKEKVEIMGIFIANLLQINRAEIICFKGKIAENALKLKGLKEELIQTIEKNLLSPSWLVKEIILSPDVEKDSLIGAALFAKELK